MCTNMRNAQIVSAEISRDVSEESAGSWTVVEVILSYGGGSRQSYVITCADEELFADEELAPTLAILMEAAGVVRWGVLPGRYVRVEFDDADQIVGLHHIFEKV